MREAISFSKRFAFAGGFACFVFAFVGCKSGMVVVVWEAVVVLKGDGVVSSKAGTACGRFGM